MKKRASPARKVLYGIIAVIALLIIGYMIYSVRVYQESGAEEEGLVACDPTGQQCVIASHGHADIEVNLCGEEVKFPLEKGDLSKQHTHKERNLIHWHDRLPYDKATETVTDWSAFKLGGFFEQMEMRFSSTCVGTYCNGDKCPSGNAGILKMTVNGVENNEFDQYVWKDHDKILIRFG